MRAAGRPYPPPLIDAAPANLLAGLLPGDPLMLAGHGSGVRALLSGCERVGKHEAFENSQADPEGPADADAALADDIDELEPPK